MAEKEINLILLALGAILDIFSALVIMIPLIVPIAMQFGIIKGLFAHLKNTKYEAAAAALRGNLYVSEDATVMAKAFAITTGGGIEKKK